MINRVEPKVVDLVKRIPGVTIENVSGKGYYPFNMFWTRRPSTATISHGVDLPWIVTNCWKILRGYGSVGNDFDQ
jgi:peptide/nickel transport system substrate-binding protein